MKSPHTDILDTQCMDNVWIMYGCKYYIVFTPKYRIC